MGREATVRCTLGGFDDMVKAVLESSELILRSSALRRRWALGGLGSLQVGGETLSFTAGSESVALYLGAKEAAAWLKKITTPAPSLAAKLGVSGSAPAFVLGRAGDAELAAALKGCTTARAEQAQQLIAVVLTPADLPAAMAQHAGMPCAHLWVVYRKGKTASPGEGEIRSTLRARGYIDTKTSAVSAELTATRYTRRAAV